MTLFRSKYRIETTRLKHHAYTHGWYFVTICTRDRLQWFGEIRDGKTALSEMGRIVEQCWSDIPHHFPHVSLDVFVVMPDHVHGIIVMNATDDVLIVETPDRASLQSKRLQSKRHPTLGVIINQCKGSASRRLHLSGYPEFSWQPRYHDRLIRSSAELNVIRKYIRCNPEHWTKETIPWNDDAFAWGM
ncbi:MAG: hypothetical protein PHZ00_04465 [Candidatus Peribacteraceae bacterium]|nr:hypothetical protein [Candidatus Peribacteraceae bacterium]